MKLDAATFLLQWGTGGLFFGWVTTRRREVSLGYGWLIRIVFGLMTLGAFVVFLTDDMTVARSIAAGCSLAATLATAIALTSSVAAPQGRRARARGAARANGGRASSAMIGRAEEAAALTGPEFAPALDLDRARLRRDRLARGRGVRGRTVRARGGAAPRRRAVPRQRQRRDAARPLVSHAAGLRRDPIKELVLWTAVIWPFEVLVFLWPTGMVQVLNGTIDDGYHGLLGWIWVACAVMTIGLVGLTWAALKERSYSAVMAATGLLYLAILTAFGTDLLARAVLKP